MAQAPAKGIRGESSRKASLFEMLKAFRVVEVISIPAMLAGAAAFGLLVSALFEATRT